MAVSFVRISHLSFLLKNNIEIENAINLSEM